jgi:uncharacterized membrane protein YhaH (DUF805 family)
MAARTESFAHRVITMGLSKRSLGTVMAAEAERSLRLSEEVFLIGTVGEMAGCTTFLSHFVSYLLFIILFFVTLIASVITLCFQKVTSLGRMGVMTLNAFPPLQGRMHAGFVHPYFIFTVAGIADFVTFFFQNQFWNKTMTQMAIFAFFLFNNTVNIFHPKIFVRKLFVTIEAIFLCKSFPLSSSAS